MFGLFSNNKKQYYPSVSQKDKKWIEETISWFVEVFGIHKIKEQPFILPTHENFPYGYMKDNEQFRKLFIQLCDCFEINPHRLIVKFFDEENSQWTNWTVEDGFTGGNTTIKESERFKILLAKSNLGYSEQLVAIIAHELSLFKLLDGGYVYNNDPSLEAYRDLVSIYFGFGIFVANNVDPKGVKWMSRTEYLQYELTSYTNALVCYITQRETEPYLKYFNSLTRDFLRNDSDFLKNTDDTLLTKEKVAENTLFYQIDKRVSAGFDERNFDAAIAACDELAEIKPENSGVYNSKGYAFLMQKKYEAAIGQFNKAINFSPYWEIPYNNRGYCRLQMGDLENAFVDIESAYQMNPDNAFTWRNMGAYYLNVNEFEKALEFFTEAEKRDPKMELINFYLGHVHMRMGNSEKAKSYFDKSTELNEYNDSMLE